MNEWSKWSECSGSKTGDLVMYVRSHVQTRTWGGTGVRRRRENNDEGGWAAIVLEELR